MPSRAERRALPCDHSLDEYHAPAVNLPQYESMPVHHGTIRIRPEASTEHVQVGHWMKRPKKQHWSEWERDRSGLRAARTGVGCAQHEDAHYQRNGWASYPGALFHHPQSRTEQAYVRPYDERYEGISWNSKEEYIVERRKIYSPNRMKETT